MSPLAWATTLPRPNPPSNLTATSTPTTITLTWQEMLAPRGLPIAYYQVLEGTVPGKLTQAVTQSGTTYTARSLNPATTYYFDVVAEDSAYEDSVPSNPISATTLPLPPPPTGLSASEPAATQVALSWQWAPLTGGVPAARYPIDCGTDDLAVVLRRGRSASVGRFRQ